MYAHVKRAEKLKKLELDNMQHLQFLSLSFNKEPRNTSRAQVGSAVFMQFLY